MLKVKTLSALAQAGELKGKRVFIRSDLNVPFNDFTIKSFRDFHGETGHIMGASSLS